MISGRRARRTALGRLDRLRPRGRDDGKPASYPTFADGLATQRVLAAVGYGPTPTG